MSTELLQAMQSMIETQNWQGYLHFRRQYILSGGKQSAISKMIRTLSDESQLTYGRYFNNPREISKHIREILHQEAVVKIAARQAERQAAFEKANKASPVWEKPIKKH
jgi:tryptophan 2,3-dioxygenase